MNRSAARLLLACSLAIALVVAAAPPAMADAAGPTNYQTEIISIDPATSALHVEMIGGDAFLRLKQLEPVEIIVLGYRAEPYLRFAPDGTVFENRRSPAVWQNQERYGNGDQPLPTFVDHTAEPQWLEVASSGHYAWHDHRSHWMNEVPPLNKRAGDQILEATVPFRVDGKPIVVTVASYWIEAPSILPAIGGAVMGLAAAAVLLRSARLNQAVVALLVAGAAALLGSIAFNSVPPETAPSRLLWLLPICAVAAALILMAVRNHTATTVYLDGLTVAAGATLTAWAILRFDALRRALIPTDAPFQLDRFVIATTLVVGAALALQGMYGLLTPKRLTPAETS